MMDLATFFSISSNLGVAIGTIVMAAAATVGVVSWRKQLYGKVGVDAAINVARAMYAVRDEISNCRSPLVLLAEYPKDDDASASKTDEAKYGLVMKNRLNRVFVCMRELRAQALLAEVVWGPEVRKSIDGISVMVLELQDAIERLAQAQQFGGHTLDGEPNEKAKLRAIAQRGRRDRDDEFSQRLLQHMVTLERTLQLPARGN